MNLLKKSLITTAALAFILNAQAEEKKANKSASTISKIQAGLYNLDTAHSKVGFEIPHLVISSVEGRFTAYEGQIELKENIQDTKVNVVINTDSIDTSQSDRDKHLKSSDFFDSAKFPKMTFKSKKITGTFEKFKLIGDLTIKDKTREVTLDGSFLGLVTDAYGNKKAAFNATTKINRQDFGLTWGKLVEAGPVVGDEVTITLKIQATQSK